MIIFNRYLEHTHKQEDSCVRTEDTNAVVRELPSVYAIEIQGAKFKDLYYFEKEDEYLKFLNNY